MNTINAALTILGGGLTALYYASAWLDARRDRRRRLADDETAEAVAEREIVEAADASVAPSSHDEVTSDDEGDGDEEADDEEGVDDETLPAEAEHAALVVVASATTPSRASDVLARVARATHGRVTLTNPQADQLLRRLEEEGLLEGHEGAGGRAYTLTGFGERVVGGGEGGVPS